MTQLTCFKAYDIRGQVFIHTALDPYAEQKPKLDTADGISLEFAGWRTGLHSPNIEPLLRLNIKVKSRWELLAKCVQLMPIS
jgi:phosphomannomutase